MKLYCPKCSYEITPTNEDIEDEKVFCINCLAYSSIKINSDEEQYLEFIQYEERI